MSSGRKWPSAVCPALAVAVCALLGPGLSAGRAAETPDGKKEVRMSLEELERMPKIDAHAHIMEFGDTLAADFIALLKKHNFKWLDICTFGLRPADLQRQIDLAQRFHRENPQQVSWATSFNLAGWNDSLWAGSAIRSIEQGFAGGAVAVKVWKDIGMELRDRKGEYVMIDNPRFEPVFKYVESRGKTLVAHIGEPRNCWLPLESMTTGGDRGYYSQNPEYHGFLRMDIPGYWEQVKARDDMLQKNPRLRVVGCHLGSLEFDTDELAERLDRFPNFAVDLAGRICHFQVQDREKVRRFILKYQDRLLYGTDNLFGWEKPGENRSDLRQELASFEKAYRYDYRYLATEEEMEAPDVQTGRLVRGLGLPAGVLKKIYHDNAVKWYPGI